MVQSKYYNLQVLTYKIRLGLFKSIQLWFKIVSYCRRIIKCVQVRVSFGWSQLFDFRNSDTRTQLNSGNDTC